MDRLEGIVPMLIAAGCDECDSWCEASGCESGHCDQEG